MLTEEIIQAIHVEAQRYEQRSAACIEALKLVQQQHGWVDDADVREVAALLDMTPDEVDGVATFYNLIHRVPVGRHVIRLCSSVSCWIMGYGQVRETLMTRLAIQPGETTQDGRFTLVTNQCLGACDHAPTLMIDGVLHHDVTPDNLETLLEQYL